MADSTFQISIPNIADVQAAYKQAPEIMGAIIAKAIAVAAANMAAVTESSQVPFRTGALSQTFAADIQGTFARWFPTRSYAPYVEFGVGPSPGRYVPAIGKRLVNGNNIGMWPGFKGNDYMGRIRSNATPMVQQAFKDAMVEFANQIARK
jgi:hypothetical protein